MVINHLEKLFVTSDASTIVNELEIQHPAARLIVLAAQAQEQEIGDATNFVSLQLAPLYCWQSHQQNHVAAITEYNALLQVLAFAGELLANAESLLRDGLHTSEVADGYSKAAAKASHLKYLSVCSCCLLLLLNQSCAYPAGSSSSRDADYQRFRQARHQR